MKLCILKLKMIMNKYVIVGASGYIGSELALEMNGNQPVLLTSASGKIGEQLRLENKDDYEKILISRGDIVYVASAISSPDIKASEYENIKKINVDGTYDFIKHALSKDGRVIFFSSDTVYGNDKKIFDEKNQSNPVGKYAEMKFEIEKSFISNPNFKAIRLSYVFSRNDKFTKFLLDCLDKSVEAEIYHPFYRQIVYIKDVTEGLLSIAKKWDEIPQSIINFGGPELLSREDLARYLKENALPLLKYRVVEPENEFFLNRPKSIKLDTSLFQQIIGRQGTSIKNAIRKEFGNLIR
jgi:dTDP-4-dehydrorhamnose reductase